MYFLTEYNTTDDKWTHTSKGQTHTVSQMSSHKYHLSSEGASMHDYMNGNITHLQVYITVSSW